MPLKSFAAFALLASFLSAQAGEPKPREKAELVKEEDEWPSVENVPPFDGKTLDEWLAEAKKERPQADAAKIDTAFYHFGGIAAKSLCELLDDKQPVVAARAEKILGRNGDWLTYTALSERYKKDALSRPRVLNALGRFDRVLLFEGIFDQALEALADENPAVRAAAARAIRLQVGLARNHIAKLAKIAGLLSKLRADSDEKVHDAAEEALDRLREVCERIPPLERAIPPGVAAAQAPLEAAEAPIKVDEKWLDEATRTMRFKGRTTNEWVEVLKKTEFNLVEGSEVEGTLFTIGKPAIRPLAALLDIGKVAKPAPDDGIRNYDLGMMAARAIGYIGAQESVAPLAELYKRHADAPFFVFQAIYQLDRFTLADEFIDAAGAMAASKDAGNRDAAAEILGAFISHRCPIEKFAEAAQALAKTAQTDNDAPARAAARDTLAALRAYMDELAPLDAALPPVDGRYGVALRNDYFGNGPWAIVKFELSPDFIKAPKEGEKADEALVVLDGSKSDNIEHNQLFYRWRQAGGEPLTLAAEQVNKPRMELRIEKPGVYLFELAVCNGKHATRAAKAVMVQGREGEYAGEDALKIKRDELCEKYRREINVDGEAKNRKLIEELNGLINEKRLK